MLKEAADFRDEVDELYAVVSALGPSDWQRQTQFRNWTINDVILHLFASDYTAITSVSDPVAYDRLRADMQRMRDTGMSMIEESRARFPDLARRELADAWVSQAMRLSVLLSERDPKDRLKWSGPGMAVRMFTTARQMETWAHGQEIYDVLSLKRLSRDRIKNIVVLGVKTFEWSFKNRGLNPPGPLPRVQLISPSGETWVWGDENADDLISGKADEFCQVVTQVRNVADTELEIVGNVSRQWMACAQCFAGPPAAPPLPGTRLKSRRMIAG